MFKLIYFGVVFVLGLGMTLVCVANFLKGRCSRKSEILGALVIVFGSLATWLATWLSMIALLGGSK